MATQAGIVQSISGKFYAKDSNGNVRELKEGDKVYENETVFGDESNTASQKIEVALGNSDAINLNANQTQAFDSSLIETAFGSEELFFSEKSVEFALRDGAMTDVVSDLREAEFANDKDITEEETAEGDEAAEDETTGEGQFVARDAEAAQAETTGVVLAKVQEFNEEKVIIDEEEINTSTTENTTPLVRTQVFESKEAFKSESQQRLGTEYEGTQYTTPFTPPPTNTTPPPVAPPVSPPPANVTPPPVESPVTPLAPPAKPSAIIKLFAADSNGDVIKDTATGNYLLANEVREGKVANYIAFAFKEETTTFNDSTKLAIQAGTIDITFNNDTATGATSQNKIDGTEDFNNTSKENVEIGKSFNTNTFTDEKDDEGNEIYTVTINTDSYNGNAYKEVEIDNAFITTTIVDKEDTIYTIIKGTTSLNEGEEATYTVQFIDKNKDPIEVENDTKVKVKYTNGTINGTQDGDTQYNTDKEIEVTIKAGKSESDPFKVKTIDDVYKESDENFKLEIIEIVGTTTGFNNVIIGDIDDARKDVTTTIVDNETVTKIALVATDSSGEITLDVNGKVDLTKNINITPEGGKLYYVAVAIDADGKPLDRQDGKVTVAYGTTTDNADKDATASIDYDNGFVEATIGTLFEVETNDDFYAEGNENFTVKISNPTETPYEKPVIDRQDTVTSTIQDNPAKVKEPTDETNTDSSTGSYDQDDTVYVKITKTPSIVEGGNLVHTVTLVDKNGVAVKVPTGQTVTVTLDYAAKSSTGTGTFTEDDLSTIVKEVIITGGNSSQNFKNITKDDFTAEGNEVYTVTITDVTQSGAFENVAIHSDNSTTGTIKDGVTLGTPTNAIVLEDGLNSTATDDITVTVDGSSYTTKIGTSENDLGKLLGITNPNGDTYTVSFDKTITTTTNTSNGKEITYSYNADGTILTATRAGDNKTVFTVELKKVSGNDVYDFKLKEPMDHLYGNNGKDTFDMPFKFNVTSNGTTSANQTFNVTVVDSVPSTTPIITTTKEDTPITIRLADDDFKAGEQVTINGATHNIGATGIAIYEQEDITKQIGTLKINSNGTVTFTPIEDYSNHDTAKSPHFTYTVKDYDGDESTSTVTINVKPVADAPGITISTPTMTEDDNNTKEGTNQVSLGLIKPSLSKDQTDKNFSTGDYPERNAEITLTITNGDKVTGAKIFKADGTTQVGSDITTANQELKVVIVTTTGDSNTIDYTYHHADITASNLSGNVVYLTESEYQSLKIQHAEDNDTDVKIKIDATSYELDDSHKPLSTTDKDLYEKTTANMTVKIDPVTDDISLAWNTATGGTINGNTFTFDSKEEGNYFDTPIDLKAILTKTSGTQIDTTPKGGDLDGSEKRTYTVSGIPEGTIITLGTQKAVAGNNGIATLVFNNTNNKVADPEFSMKLPEHWSGTVTNAKITLSVQDKGVDSGDTAGAVKTAEVYFNVTVTPVADLATIQVAQAIGFEDAGRSKGNTADKNGVIDKPQDGIPLEIKVSSDDKDGSETFDVTINDIPADAVIYYGGVLQTRTGNSITIVDFDNVTSLVVIPPHNSDEDFTLNVSAVTKDGTNTSGATTTIDVIVKNKADAPVGTDLKTDIKVDEDNQLNLKDIYTTPNNLASYDDSEVLTVKIDFKNTGITIVTGSPYYIEDGMYVVKASDISADNIKLNLPKDFSGDTNFDLTYVTTEKAGEGDSKTWNTDTVNIFVNPIADNVTVAGSSTIYEDADGSANKIDLKPTLTDSDGNGVETIESVWIAVDSVKPEYKLVLGSTSGSVPTKETKNLGFGNKEYYKLTEAQADQVYIINKDTHKIGAAASFDLEVVYTVKDTNNTVSDTKNYEHTHTVNVQAITDAPDIQVTNTTTTTAANVVISSDNKTITVSEDGTNFTVKVNTTSSDKDSSEEVQRVEIHGVPKGVSIDGATYKGHSGADYGIWVIENPADKSLNSDGTFTDIKFNILSDSDFTGRDITIKTFTKDIGADEKMDFVNIRLNDFRPGSGTGPGTQTTPDFELTAKNPIVNEDTTLTLDDFYSVANTTGTVAGSSWAVTFTDLPTGSMVEGKNGATIFTYEQDGKTHYVVSGTGQQSSDIQNVFKNIKITPPKDMNTSGDTDGTMTISGTISSTNGAASHQGATVSQDLNILPVTDEMTVAVTANNIDEDGTSNLSITLSNPSDGSKAELVGNSITIKVTENWADVATGGGTKGTLTNGVSDKYNIVDNGGGTFTITPKSGNFTTTSVIDDLVYTPAPNRDGSVAFEVSVDNKETGSTLELNSKGDTSITVTPVIDTVLDASVVTATGTEDTAITVGSTTLANPVKLEIATSAFPDGSEKLGNVILDEVPNGFTVWYKDASNNLVMATNIGKSGEKTFDLTLNISGDAEVHRNKWLVPNSGTNTPEIYINAPENWSGEFDFKANITVKEQNGGVVKTQTVDIIGTITPVADGVTIAPTKTFGDAFSWIDLKLNANMKDVDGSEVMNLELGGLGKNAQFRLTDGTLLGEDNAKYEGTTWKLSAIAYDQINNIQFTNDKSVDNVTVKAMTAEVDASGNPISEVTLSSENNGEFKLDIKDTIGDFKLDTGVSLDFNNLDAITTLKGVNTIDLNESGKNKILNLTLKDVLDMSDGLGQITITGIAEDEVLFKDGTGNDAWSKTAGSGADLGFDIYSNSSDDSVKVKVKAEISDGITG